MKSYSKASLTLTIMGILLFCLNWFTMDYSESIVLTGVIFLLVGVVLGDQVRVIPFDVPDNFSGILPAEVMVE